jgi:rhamnogalacturonyl hydrolase YesR
MNHHSVHPKRRFAAGSPILAAWMLFSSVIGLWGDPAAKSIVSRKATISVMKRVCDWQLAHPVEINAKAESAWARSAFYTGVMATYFTTGKKRYLRQAMRWADGNRWGADHGWQVGPNRRLADDQACGHAYTEIFFLKRNPAMIADLKTAFDAMIEAPRPGREEWYWCDSLFMAPPTLVRLAVATGDRRYLDFCHGMWWDNTAFLFDEETGLYYRDKNWFDRRGPSGKKIFWSRGNGWVMGGLVQVLEYIPADDPFRARYEALYQKMAAAVAPLQGQDGLWRSNLLEPESAPAPETSGSGFFCYALAWGVNHGILDRATYLPVALKAWEGLCGAVRSDGKLGWVQKIGDRPADIRADDNQEYGSGAFLLAGSEVAKFGGSSRSIWAGKKPTIRGSK